MRCRPRLFLGMLALVLGVFPAGCDRPSPGASNTPAGASEGNAPPTGARAPSQTVRDPATGFGAAEREAAGVHYVEIVTGGADPASELPLVMAIHGLGDRPENFASLLADLSEPARIALPRGLSPYGGGFAWFSLQRGLTGSEVEREVRAAAGVLAGALGAIARERPTRGKPIVTGFSQGGALSFALALLHPDAVAAAFPVGGWVPFALPDVAGGGGAAAYPRIIALHGGADPRIPPGPTREAVGRVRALGISVELREFPGVVHAVPEPMRRELTGLIAAAVRGR